jgi:5,10-methylenetetrahydromethanopterin reductase
VASASPTKSMNLSVNLMPEAPVSELVSLAKMAEELGYRRVWVYDEGLAMRDVYVTMTAIAAATTKVQIGTGITNPYTRHPSTTAAAIATLHEFSGGRAFLGLGAGGSLTLGPLAIDRSKPLTATRETLLACRKLFDGETVTLRTDRFALVNAKLDFGDPAIEIWLAGRGPNMLAMGGELANGVMLDFLDLESMDETIGLVRAGAARSSNDAKLSYSTLVLTSEEEVFAARPHLTYRLVDSPAKTKARLGITEADVANIREAMSESLTAAAVFIKPEWVRPFVIAGTPDECALQMRHLSSAYGFDEFLLPILDLADGPRLMNIVADINARIKTPIGA